MLGGFWIFSCIFDTLEGMELNCDLWPEGTVTRRGRPLQGQNRCQQGVIDEERVCYATPSHEGLPSSELSLPKCPAGNTLKGPDFQREGAQQK